MSNTNIITTLNCPHPHHQYVYVLRNSAPVSWSSNMLWERPVFVFLYNCYLIVTTDINTITVVLIIIITIYLKSSAPVSWTSNMLWERPIRLRRVRLLSQMCQGLHRSPWNQSQIVFIFDWLFRGVSRHIEINFRLNCKLAEEPQTSPEDAPMVCSALKLAVSIHNKHLPPLNTHTTTSPQCHLPLLLRVKNASTHIERYKIIHHHLSPKIF